MIYHAVLFTSLLLALQHTPERPRLCRESGDQILSQNQRALRDSVALCKAWSRVVPAVRKHTNTKIKFDSVLTWRNDVPDLNGGPGSSYYLFWIFFRDQPAQLEAYVYRKSGRIVVKRPEQ